MCTTSLSLHCECACPVTIIAEHQVAMKYSQIINTDYGHLSILGMEPGAYQEAVYASLRKGFLSELQGAYEIDDHFNFASYLEPLLGHTLADFVEVRWRCNVSNASVCVCVCMFTCMWELRVVVYLTSYFTKQNHHTSYSDTHTHTTACA